LVEVRSELWISRRWTQSASAASAVTPRFPRVDLLRRAFVHPILRANAACVIFPGCKTFTSDPFRHGTLFRDIRDIIQ
jgi:hypothetical protein